MSLKDKTLFDDRTKLQKSIDILREFEPVKGYSLAFSGGKDSISLKRLAQIAKVKFTAHYNVVGIDPPELIKYIRKYHPDVIWRRAEKGFFGYMLDKRFPPLRQMRWCCELLKEAHGKGIILTGIRKAESAKRSRRRMIEVCNRDGTKIYIHPIINWTDAEVWEFIHDEKIPYCELYDKGRKRIGCLMCPMAPKSQRLKDAKEYPQYVRAFRRIFKKLWRVRAELNMPFDDNWKTSDEHFEWWLYEMPKKKEDPDQQCFFFDN